ncbi:GTPase [Dankookia sp. P2]|uniref:GTPase n=1 Tax=Dankookia sp. P2 TaxID=3423955 RepID=UPI003D66A4B3
MGFQRTTREPRLHAWPPPPAPPVLLFLDTPGIGADDGDSEAEARRAMAQAEDQAHVILVVVRAEDMAIGALVQALTEIRRRHRDWPVIIAQTRLHDLYPTGMRHLFPYPFDGTQADFGLPVFRRTWRELWRPSDSFSRQSPASLQPLCR